MIRPELRAIWIRWRGAALPFAAAVALISFGWQALARGGWITAAAVGLLLCIALIALFVEIQHARLRRPVTAPGAVFAEERRIGFLGPERGAFVDLDAITMIEIVTAEAGPEESDVFWILHHKDGPPLEIPGESEGADRLFDALSPLPGIDWEAVIHAMSSTTPARFLIWQRQRNMKQIVD